METKNSRLLTVVSKTRTDPLFNFLYLGLALIFNSPSGGGRIKNLPPPQGEATITEFLL